MFEEVINSVNDIMLEYIQENSIHDSEGKNSFTAADLGLDERCNGTYHVSEEVIIVGKVADRTLQYYGGFEFVPEENRIAMGEYVVYLAESLCGNRCERVQECINNVKAGNTADAERFTATAN